MRCSAGIRATGRESARARDLANRCARPIPAAAPRALASSMQRHAYVGLPAFAAALGGMTARADRRAARLIRGARAGYDYFWFYRQFWREDAKSARAAALARSAYRSRRRVAHQGRSNQHGALARGAPAAARPPIGRVHAAVDPALLVDERRRRGKLLARRLMEPRLPAGHLDRPKSGFGLPVHRWLKAARGSCKKRSNALRARGALRRAVGNEFRRAWSLLVLDRWFTAFG